MALLQYLQCRDSLLDTKASLSFAIPAQAIAWANQEVQAAVEDIQERRKQGAYNCYSPTDRADIGKYASQHGVDVAISHECRDPLSNPPFSQPIYVNKFCGNIYIFMVAPDHENISTQKFPKLHLLISCC